LLIHSQVFDAASAFRGRLKTFSRQVVLSAYSNILGVEDFMGNQLEEQGIVMAQVANALKGAKYLEGPRDAEVRHLLLIFLYLIYLFLTE